MLLGHYDVSFWSEKMECARSLDLGERTGHRSALCL